MIKQSWNITSEEKLRILNLHESATRNLYLIKEQNPSPVQGPGPTQKVLGSDDEFKYVIVQPSSSVKGGYINYKKEYYILAKGEDRSYICNIVEKNESGKPMKVEVDRNRPIPDFRKDEFLFNMTKIDKTGYSYSPINDLVKNAKVGDEIDPSTDSATGLEYYAVVWYDGRVLVIGLKSESTQIWNYQPWYDLRLKFLDFDKLKNGTTIQFNPAMDYFKSKKIRKYFSKIIPTLFESYPVEIGEPESEPNDKPNEEIEVPQPLPLGDKFRDNISTPSIADILNDSKFLIFKKFVEETDISKYQFDIMASASKCAAGNKEADRSKGKWSQDKDTYPDVTVDAKADKSDIGNLNLTKARAQNLKNFLVANIPQLKNARFRVVALGSIGTCGSEEQNKEYRRVDLTVTKL